MNTLNKPEIGQVFDPSQHPLISEIIAPATPEQLLRPANVIKIGEWLRGAMGVLSINERPRLADAVREHMWQAMGSQPSRNPQHLAAAALFEGVLGNDLTRIGVLFNDHVTALSQRIDGSEPCVLILEPDRVPEFMVYDASAAPAPGLMVGLIKNPTGFKGEFAFGVGFEGNTPISLQEVAKTWLDQDNHMQLDPESLILSLVQGKEATLIHLKTKFSKLSYEISEAVEWRKEQKGATLEFHDALYLGGFFHDKALCLGPLMTSVEKLGISYESLNITEQERNKFQRIIAKYGHPQYAHR